MTPTQVSFEKNEEYVSRSIIHERNKIKPKFKIDGLVGKPKIMKFFSKGDTTKWRYERYSITQSIDDTLPSYRKKCLPERHNEPLLRNLI